jgi:hypothetical protein
VHSVTPDVAFVGHGQVTKVTIAGTDLGLSFDDVLRITLSGVPCQIDREGYISTAKLVCSTDAELTTPRGPVSVVTIHGGVGEDASHGFGFECALDTFSIPSSAPGVQTHCLTTSRLSRNFARLRCHGVQTVRLGWLHWSRHLSCRL